MHVKMYNKVTDPLPLWPLHSFWMAPIDLIIDHWMIESNHFEDKMIYIAGYCYNASKLWRSGLKLN